MEDFFIKLGFMTQKNNAELIQEIRALRTSIDALAAEISQLNRTSTANHNDVTEKISALAETSAANHDDVTEKISVLANDAAINHNDIKNSFRILEKNINSLTSKVGNDNSSDKKILANMEELLRLTVANQMMNLVEK